ncbi:hypothetical protein [Costertonia aggregata]|uniref:Uncharacterized protein n=1 Tax=Costertonia aggregata TaxID=343403 RepID=A0A7H9ALL3_9FLAO|nr:hypothetical protein [Costertonia aggregata]QLG44350.1 hypothetical protein HYG79_02980 [Costertonia aggregata]
MKLHAVVLIFVLFCLTSVFSISIALVFLMPFQEGDSDLFKYIPFAIFLFGCLLTVEAFKYESNKSKKFFEGLFKTMTLYVTDIDW